MIRFLNFIGSAGTVFSGFGIACCLPLFVTVGSALGLGFLASYSVEMTYLMQFGVFLAVAATLWAYRSHKNILPVLLAVLSSGLIVYAVNTSLNSRLIYAGMAGLIGTSVFNAILLRRCDTCVA